MAFGDKVNSTVEWIQTKIGKHDKAFWEQQAEKKQFGFNLKSHLNQQDICYVPKKLSKYKNELIDVDLIRGSTFTKPKASSKWTDITFFGILKILFLPFYYEWWISKTSLHIFSVACVMWVMQIWVVILLARSDNVQFDEVLLAETVTPLLLWLIVGITFCQAVATDMGKAKKSAISSFIKKSKPGCNSKSSTTKPSTAKTNNKCNTTKSNNTKKSNGFISKKNDSSNLRRRAVLKSSEETKSVSSTSSSSPCPDMFDDTSVLSTEDTTLPQTKPVLLEEPAIDLRVERETDKKSNVSDSESDHDEQRRRRGSSSESDKETDSSEHNGMTEGMWTESETDSRTTLLKGRDLNPTFSTINENPPLIKSPSTAPTFTLNNTEIPDNRPLSPGVEGRDTSHRDSVSEPHARSEKVRVKIWLNEDLVKIEMSPLEIGYAIISKVENGKNSLEYVWLGVILSFGLSILPLCFRAHAIDLESDFKLGEIVTVLTQLSKEPMNQQLVHILSFLLSMSLSICLFTLFVVAERTYCQRYNHAKFFNAITSMRRAKQYGLPHFRLRNIQNIRAWLSLRSLLRRVGPQRSVGVIITSSFIIMLTILTVVCFQFITKGGECIRYYFTWCAICWSLSLSVYLLRLFTLGSNINEKFNNQALLITEQINLFFYMQQSPHKKDTLTHANQVLQLSSKLLKEVDNRQHISGFVMSPLMYNLMRVFLLSAFSGLFSEILGFKLKLWKMIK